MLKHALQSLKVPGLSALVLFGSSSLLLVQLPHLALHGLQIFSQFYVPTFHDGDSPAYSYAALSLSSSLKREFNFQSEIALTHNNDSNEWIAKADIYNT